MTTDPTTVAAAFYAAIEKAWNAADGAAFGAEFAADTVFVDIRGVKHRGGPAELGGAHQGIFDTIYKGSVIRYDLEDVRALRDDVVVANATGTLDCPDGPFAGVRQAVSTVVLVPDGTDWRAVAFHNTQVTA